MAFATDVLAWGNQLGLLAKHTQLLVNPTTAFFHSKLNLLSNDLYISTIAGGQAKEPGSDLAIVAALASAATSKPIARATCAIGEISLTGQVRPVPRMEYRLREAARLGFTTAVIPPLRKPVHVEGLQLVESNTLSDALDALGVRK